MIGGVAAAGHAHLVVIVKDSIAQNHYRNAFWGQHQGIRNEGKSKESHKSRLFHSPRFIMCISASIAFAQAGNALDLGFSLAPILCYVSSVDKD